MEALLADDPLDVAVVRAGLEADLTDLLDRYFPTNSHAAEAAACDEAGQFDQALEHLLSADRQGPDQAKLKLAAGLCLEKLRRPAVEARFSKEIAALYEPLPTPAGVS